jgi:hypothetical protein
MTLGKWEVLYREYGYGTIKRTTIEANSQFHATLKFFQQQPKDHLMSVKYMEPVK